MATGRDEGVGIPTVVVMAATAGSAASASAQARGLGVPTVAAGTGAAGVTELVTSRDGIPATRLSGPEADVQPDRTNAIMAPTYAKQGSKGAARDTSMREGQS